MKFENVRYVAKRDGSLEPWAGFGANRQEYEKWIPHVCGVCCLKMVGDTLHKTEDATLYALTMRCLEEGAFKVSQTDEIEGIFHHPLSRVARKLGIEAVVDGSISAAKIEHSISLGHMVMLSIDLAKVNPSLRGGHLVLVHDYDDSKGTFILHDCSSVVSPDGRNVKIERRDLELISNGKGLILG